MSRASAATVTFRMTVSDAGDGAIRILTDAQRFGLDLVALDLQARRPAGDADLTITLSSSRPIDADLLAIRFVRHPAVLRVKAEAADNAPGVETDVVIAA